MYSIIQDKQTRETFQFPLEVQVNIDVFLFKKNWSSFFFNISF